MNSTYVVGIDVGGQTSKLGVVDARGTVLAQTVIRTDTYDTVEPYIAELAAAVKKVIAEAGAEGKIRGVGVGAPNGNYYTGTIIEVKALDVEIGSITGGGRYDNLTGVFGMSGLSGVGISFGADRIYDVLNQLDLYPAHITSSVRVMFVNFGQAEAMQSAKYIAQLRGASISAELYPDAAKMKKQMSYADDNKIPYVAIIGESELENGTIALKNMISGEQQSMTIDELIQTLG